MTLRTGRMCRVGANALVLAAFSVSITTAQTAPAAPQAAAGGGGRGGGGFSQPAPSDWYNHDGWIQIFDGKTLANWNCDTSIWSVADESITAKSTPEKPTGTTYCSWMGGEPANFELKAEFRMLVGGNSGIQYRSIPAAGRSGAPGGPGGGAGGPGAGRGAGAPAAPPAASATAPVTTALLAAQPCQMQIPVMYPPPAGRGGGGGGRGGRAAGAGPDAPGGQPAGAARGGGGGRAPSPYDVGGYQYDFDYTGNYPGNLYENGMSAGAPPGTSNRGIISYKGQIVHLLPDARRETVGCIADGTDLKGVMNINGWNYIHIIARGPVLLHLLNGRLMTATIDDDPVRRKMNGRIAVQIEGMGEVYFRNLWLKNW